MTSDTWTRKHGERGASMVEYALLVALIAIVAIGGLRALGNQVDGKFNQIQQTLVNTNPK
jgi:Flp pilus assembly pilin Flp